jgi:PAS domain-containing protein
MIDFAAIFAATPTPSMVLTPDLVICEVNPAYVRASSREPHELIGRYVFDVFPDNPHDPDASGVRNVRASMERAVDTGDSDVMPVQRYDVEVATGDDGRRRFEERYGGFRATR